MGIICYDWQKKMPEFGKTLYKLYRNELFIFAISFSLFGAFLYLRIPTDIQAHVKKTLAVVNGTMPPGADFFYYLIIYAVAFFSKNKVLLGVSSVVLLSLAMTAKFVITKRFMTSQIGIGNTSSGLFVVLFSNLLLLAFSLPTSSILKGQFYLGQTPPNVWHNSTTILLMPFALALFWLSYEQIIKPEKRRIFLITIFCVLNILIKPSFYFVFTIVYPLMLIRYIGVKKELWLNLLPIIIGAISLLAEYYLIYRIEGPYSGTSSVAINPFLVWSYYSPNIFLSIVASTFFPLVYMFFNWKEVFRNALLGYATLSYLVSILIYSTLTEIGTRQYHANFSWQCIVCNYILFTVVSARFIQKACSNGKINWQNKLILASFLLHVIFGCLYLIRFFVTKEYA